MCALSITCCLFLRFIFVSFLFVLVLSECMNFSKQHCFKYKRDAFAFDCGSKSAFHTAGILVNRGFHSIYNHLLGDRILSFSNRKFASMLCSIAYWSKAVLKRANISRQFIYFYFQSFIDRHLLLIISYSEHHLVSYLWYSSLAHLFFFQVFFFKARPMYCDTLYVYLH